MQSMTGYGRGFWQGDDYSLQVELRSVNNRYMNVRVRLPESLLRFEPYIEGQLKQELRRGSIVCQVQVKLIHPEASISHETFLATYKSLTDFARQHNVPGEVTISTLASLPQVFEKDLFHEDQISILETGLSSSLKEALVGLKKMRQEEGQALLGQFRELLSQLSQLAQTTESLAPGLTELCQKRYKERLNQMGPSSLDDDPTLIRELAVLADRADISEELARLKSHFKQFDQTLDLKTAVGRKLDFLLQEINREINTIGSKSLDVQISQHVVEMKTVAEKIREQVQNVE